MNYEKDLSARLAKLKRTRQRYLDLYADELISREELQEKIGGMKSKMERLENDLELVRCNLDKGSQLEELIQRTFQDMENITSVKDMTNAQLKRIVRKIEVDKDGNVDIYLRLLGDLGLDETVLVRNGCRK